MSTVNKQLGLILQGLSGRLPNTKSSFFKEIAVLSPSALVDIGQMITSSPSSFVITSAGRRFEPLKSAKGKGTAITSPLESFPTDPAKLHLPLD